ncbi:MAG: restriction endonuclease subunit S [Chryseotalea sp.]|jgi:type I restriction enzyme S subunit
MNNIKEYNFSDLYEMGSGISSKPEQAGHGAPFVSFSTVFNNYFLPEKVKDSMDTSEGEQEVYSVKGGDILLTRTSETIDELGMSCVVLEDYPRATFSGFVKRLRPTQSDVTYPKFMGFYLRSKFFRKTMTNNAVLTLRASLNEDIFSYLKLYLPDYDTQKRIGDFLYSLNEKIELNNRINAELEDMAKTIYDYWFVQFDFPNKNGKPYKASGGKMVWSEELKREIPEGWEVKELGDYASIKKGVLITEKTADTTGKVKVVSAGIDFSYMHSESNYDENTITISASGASAGYINFWREPIFACDCTTVRGSSVADTLQLLGFLRNHQEFIYKQARGSAQPHVYPKDIQALKFAVPPKIIISQFGHLVESGNEKISNNLKENQKLTELRDWLLPMLMNGQIKIKDAEGLSFKALEKDDELSMAAEAKEVCNTDTRLKNSVGVNYLNNAARK